MNNLIDTILTSRWAERAEHKRRKKDFVGMARCVAAAAAAGNTDAQLRLAALYQGAVGLPRSPESAAFWLEKAAIGGNTEAMVKLAKLQLLGYAPSTQLFGNRGSPNYHHARSWAQRAAVLGSPEGKAILAVVLEYTGGGEQTVIERLLEEGAAAKDPSACLQLAVRLLKNPSWNDRSRIASLVQTAADLNLPHAVYLHGVISSVGYGCDRDQEHALALFEKASTLGFAQAMTRYGAMLMADGHSKMSVGETWLRKAVTARNGIASSMIGALRAGQDGLPPNFSEAFGWFQRAGELNDPFGARVAGLLSYLGFGDCCGSDVVLALLKKSRQLAAQPISDLAFLICPKGLPFKFEINASGWFEARARAGDRLAIRGLAACKLLGLDGTPNHASALECLKLLN